MTTTAGQRVALVTGVGRRRSIGTGIAIGLAHDGWNLALNYWRPYDDRLGYERRAVDPESIAGECRDLGVAVELVPADLSDPSVPAELIRRAQGLGRVTGLVLTHCESVDSSLLTTDLQSWDRHFAVNSRATWLLIKAFAEQLPAVVSPGDVGGRLVALTSDHFAGNVPYGASKAALDRIVLAAAVELADRGVRANVVNPGPIDTGWMDDSTRAQAIAMTAAGRLGTAQDTADLIRFLFSDQGAWINGQILASNGGFRVG